MVSRMQRLVFAAWVIPALVVARPAVLAAELPGHHGTGDSGCSDAAVPEGCGDSCGDMLCSDPAKLFGNICCDDLFLKELRSGTCCGLKYSLTGEIRYRHMDERNRLRPGGPGDSEYELWRFTPMFTIGNEFVTAGVQAIDASIFGLDAPYTPLPIDENRSDLLQYYLDLQLLDLDEGTLKYRYGRQMLNYGSQRLVSPLAWANTYRNFEGHKLMAASGDWTLDLFAVRNVNGTSGNINRPYSFDNPDQSRWFAGAYATWSGIPNNTLDFYYLYFDETESLSSAIDGTRHTLGMRNAGKAPVRQDDEVVGSWNWDVEGAWQFGEDNYGSAAMRDVQAGMFGALGGYTFDNLAWKPGIGGIFYWASGDDASTTGDINTFFSLYPLGHAYWGQIDNFGGMNLLDYGVQLSASPHQKLNVVTQWHCFDLADPDGAIINIAGASLPGSGDRHVGNEVDIVGTYKVNDACSLQAGYFWFFYGAAVNDGPLVRPDAEQLYLQATYSY